jgi:uncharacterized repeat protein (TIGR01451 family)
MRRWLALAAMVAVLGAAAPARGQIVRAFTPRFTTSSTGDITLIGNTLMTCPASGTCTNGRNGTGGSVDDNDFNMVYVDVDGDASTFSSSTADLVLPSGATVLWAGLYWGGETNNANRGTCRFATPVAGYATITAARLDAIGTVYQGFADVTTPVRAGGNGTYRVANVYSTPNTSDVFAGWGLVVVYQLTSLPMRNLVVFDGFGQVYSGSPITMTVSGFVTPPAGQVRTRLGVLVHEGDLGYTGDAFNLNGVALSDTKNPATNFFNSSISRFDTTVTAKNPNYVNQLGFDIDLVKADGRLANNATSATIQLTSSGDTYFPGVVTFATDLYAPVIDASSFQKRVADVNGGAVRPGDVLEYTLMMKNVGQDNATQTVMRDTLPANVTYVPGSLSVVSGANAGAKTDAAGDDQMEYVAASRSVVARVGTGANATTGGQLNVSDSTTVRFRATVTVPAPNGSTVSNQAGISYVGAQTGTALTGRSDGDLVTGGAQPTVVSVTAPVLSGTVFEDVNYGGGAGRTLAASGGVARPGARVELYGSSGAYLGADTTDAAGGYSFDGWTPGNYTLRAVNATVLSSRSGAAAGLLPVQTFRTDASSGAVVADGNRVGGETPGLADAAANTTSATLASLTTGVATPQSVTPVTLATASLGGLDFGYGFDVVVNANDAGQGSLRQFVVNANTLGNTGLAQAGLPAGYETSVFMVSDGLAHAGLRAGLASLLTSGTVRVTLASALPSLSDAATRVDGTTQTLDVGETNPGLLGTGGVVGAEDLPLPQVPAPEVEVRDGATLALAFDLSGANVTLRGLAITGFGNAVASDANADVRVGAAAAGARLERCVIGTTATSFADPGTLRSGGDHVRALGGDNGVLDSCLVAFGAGSGLALTAGSNGWNVARSEFRQNAQGSSTRAGVNVESSGALRLAQSLVVEHPGAGVDAATSTGACLFDSLTARRSGLASVAGVPNAGIRLGGSGSRVERCALEDNVGAGVMVAATASANVITRDRVSGNGTVSGGSGVTNQIGIDLLSAADDAARGTSPYVTRNDAGDGDTGGNGLVNFPVLASAVLSNGQLTLQGWARPGTTLEVFVAAADPSGFGEGRTWVATLVEGSAADLDAATSSYSGMINGVNQGADNTNRFRFTIADPPAVAAGVELTATGTLAASGTSEFSGRVRVTTGVSLRGVAYEDRDHNAQRDAGEAGTGATLWAKLIYSGGTASTQVSGVDAATGAYAFTFVNAATYDIVLDDSPNFDDVTPGRPAGWIGTEAASGVIPGVIVTATDQNGLDFGLWHGSRVDGTVFRDDGAGGGTANDGARQGGEAGAAAARVRLLGAACPSGVCDSATTTGTGAFRLWLPAAAAGASARVAEVNPSGWLSTGGQSGATGGSYARASDDVTFTAVSGVAYDGVAFGDVPLNTWTPPLARAVAAGGVAWYAHTFTAGSAGTVSLGVAETPVPALPGWSVTLYRDDDCDGVLDAGEVALPATVALVAGQSLCVIARHATPAAAPPGATETATLTASYSYTGAAPALGSTAALADLTTILLANGLLLAKSVDLPSVAPGGLLTYTITYSNPGTQGLSGIVIRDATPSWTVFDSASCGTLGAGLGGCALTQQPSAGATGNVVWTLSGTLAPGGSGSVSFRVRVP